MSDTPNPGFAQFVPGFDFLQNLAKNTQQAVPQMPNMGNWIAPTLSVEDLDKRIAELKAVHFWLDQNSKALAATVQALEVQKMTLATLKGMNVSMGELANAFKFKAPETAAPSPSKVSETTAWTAPKVSEVAAKAEEVDKSAGDGAKPAGVAGLVDPMQLWTSLTQQFQTIAASAMAEAGKVSAMAEAGQASAMDMGKNMLKGVAKGATKPPAKTAARAPAKKAPAKKTPAKKAASPSSAKSASRRRT